MDIDDFFKKIKKYFNFDSDRFDLDFFVFPDAIVDTNKNIEEQLDDIKSKGYKISYHFESGMDQPEIKIESDIEDDILNDYIKKVDSSRFPIKFPAPLIKSNSILDANKFCLEPYEEENSSQTCEPFAEINDFDEFSEILIEAPGISQEDITISFTKNGTSLVFSAANGNRTYEKIIQLPFESSEENYTLDINNGIITIRVMR